MHNLRDCDPVTVSGVGGEEKLNCEGDLIMPLRLHDGAATVLNCKAHQADGMDVNILSACQLAQRGFNLVLRATEVLPQLRGCNPSTSPEGHALVTTIATKTGPMQKAIWLRVMDGILVMDVMDTAITPAMLPGEVGRIMYRSGKAARKVRTESAARRIAKDEGIAYPVALRLAKEDDQGTDPELYVIPEQQDF